MTNAIVYSSRTGNTKLLAETIKEMLPGETCVYFGAPDEKALSADRIFVGFWTDRGRCDKQTEAFLKALTNQEIYLFGTAGFGGNQNYFDKILKRTSKNLRKTVHIAGSFMCQGKMPVTVRQRYEKLLAGPIKIPNLKRMITNFDCALSHPDQDDLDALKKELEQIRPIRF